MSSGGGGSLGISAVLTLRRFITRMAGAQGCFNQYPVATLCSHKAFTCEHDVCRTFPGSTRQQPAPRRPRARSPLILNLPRAFHRPSWPWHLPSITDTTSTTHDTFGGTVHHDIAHHHESAFLQLRQTTHTDQWRRVVPSGTPPGHCPQTSKKPQRRPGL